MNFINPANLWFLAIIPAIVILYFLKLLRKPKIVSSTYLWKRALEQYKVNRPFQKFQNQLLLWLQLLILTFLVFSAARPFIDAPETTTGIHIFLVDQSASMNTKEDNVTRLDLAKTFLRNAIENKRGSDKMSIIGFSDRSFVYSPMTAEKEKLLKDAQEILPSKRPTRIQEAWQMALSIARQYDASDIYIVSDGGFGSLDQLTQAHATVHYIPIGASQNNLGIVHLEARRENESTKQIEVFARVKNCSTSAKTTHVQLFLNDRLVDAQEITISGYEENGVIFKRSPQDEGLIEARIAQEDDFILDNRAWIPLKPTNLVRVILVANENLFLKKNLSSHPQVELTCLTHEEFKNLKGQIPENDLIVFDNFSMKDLSRGNYLFINSAPEIEGFTSPQQVANPQIVKWDSEHALARFINFGTLHVAKAKIYSQPPWMKTLLTTEKGALISEGERSGRRIAIVSFQILDSDWPMRVSFPLFIANAIRWASIEENLSLEKIVHTGEPLTIPIPLGAETGTISTPTGKEVHANSKERSFTLSDTDEPGPYRVKWSGRNKDFLYTINLLDLQESTINVPPEVLMGDYRLLGKNESRIVRKELWKWLAILAVGFLLLEWLIYQLFRR